ncbi:MAG: pilus assembly protein PilM [Syntrophales bacterium]
MREKVLGLDIGRSSIKAVQITAGLNGRYRITGSALIPVRDGGNIKEALDVVFEDSRLKSNFCVTSLPARDFSFRDIVLPFKEKKKIEQTIGYELEPLIPYPIDDVLVDFVIKKQSEDSEIFAACVPKSVVQERIQLLEKTEVSVIEIEGAAVALKILRRVEPDQCALLLDVGAKESLCVFLRDGNIFQIRSFFFGGDTITEAIAAALHADAGEAEREKIEGDPGRIRKAVIEASRKFFVEIDHTLGFLKQKQNESEKELRRIFLTGGGAMCSPFAEELGRHFDVLVERLDISAADHIQIDEDVKKTWNPLLMNQALALAAHGTKKGKGFNFRKGEYETRAKYLTRKKILRQSVTAALVIVGILAVDLCAGFYIDKLRLDRLKQETRMIFNKSCPEVTKIVDPVQQLKTRIAEAKKLSPGARPEVTFLDLLRDISILVPESSDFLITNLDFDGERMELKGETANFDMVETIKNGLGRSGYFKNVTVSSASLIKEKNRVEFEVRMNCAK